MLDLILESNPYNENIENEASIKQYFCNLLFDNKIYYSDKNLPTIETITQSFSERYYDLYQWLAKTLLSQVETYEIDILDECKNNKNQEDTSFLKKYTLQIEYMSDQMKNLNRCVANIDSAIKPIIYFQKVISAIYEKIDEAKNDETEYLMLLLIKHLSQNKICYFLDSEFKRLLIRCIQFNDYKNFVETLDRNSRKNGFLGKSVDIFTDPKIKNISYFVANLPDYILEKQIINPFSATASTFAEALLQTIMNKITNPCDLDKEEKNLFTAYVETIFKNKEKNVFISLFKIKTIPTTTLLSAAELFYFIDNNSHHLILGTIEALCNKGLLEKRKIIDDITKNREHFITVDKTENLYKNLLDTFSNIKTFDNNLNARLFDIKDTSLIKNILSGKLRLNKKHSVAIYGLDDEEKQGNDIIKYFVRDILEPLTSRFEQGYISQNSYNKIKEMIEFYCETDIFYFNDSEVSDKDFDRFCKIIEDTTKISTRITVDSIYGLNNQARNEQVAKIAIKRKIDVIANNSSYNTESINSNTESDNDDSERTRKKYKLIL